MERGPAAKLANSVGKLTAAVEKVAGPLKKGRFYSLLTGTNSRNGTSMSQQDKSPGMQRVVEALLIAAITSFSVYVFSIPKLETKIDTLQTSVSELKVEINEIRRDVYIPATRAYPYGQEKGDK